jgi:hypothetical protein
MLPELYIPGMDEAVRGFAERKGLIDHMYYYALPPGLLGASTAGMLRALTRAPDGQYFFLSHPALYSDETLRMGNATVSGKQLAKNRSGEARLLGARGILPITRALGVRPLRYDEAAPLPARLTPADVRAILAGAAG